MCFFSFWIGFVFICLLLVMELMVFVHAEKMWEKRQTFPFPKVIGIGNPDVLLVYCNIFIPMQYNTPCTESFTMEFITKLIFMMC